MQLPIDLELSTIDKLAVYRQIAHRSKKLLLSGEISAAQGEEVIKLLKAELPGIFTRQAALDLVEEFEAIFPFLGKIHLVFASREEEKIHQVLVLLLDKIMAKNNYRLASKILDEIKDIEDNENWDKLSKLEKNYAKEYQEALETVKKG